MFIFESYCFPSNLEFGRDRIELEGTEENSSYYSGTEEVPKIQPAILDHLSDGRSVESKSSTRADPLDIAIIIDLDRLE